MARENRVRVEPQHKRILVIDDEESLRHMLSVLLRKQGYDVDTAENGEDALTKVGSAGYEFILSDIMMPEMDGKAFLREAVRQGIPATIIMMSAYGTMDTAIECMKLGAYDYISKPFKNDEIILVLKKAEERERLKEENTRLKAEINREYTFADIISRAPRMQELFGLVRKLCEVKTTVLVQGESGTGKELIARALHFTGSRRHAPFVAVNCGAIPENLLESELFGHVKGAFTDAASDKAGLFEQADGGTLFLDEIGEMPLSLQVKLLRVIQDEEIKRVGGTTAKKVNVRVVSATAKRLDDEVAAGHFREDLFFRLNVFTISMPPLRERVEDIPLLVGHFLARFSRQFHKEVTEVSPAALQALVRYPWPGNVRELENVLERGMILCEEATLDLDYLPERIAAGSTGGAASNLSYDNLSIKQAGEAMERELIRRALEKTGGNRTHAARLLEISHRALLYKLKEYCLDEK
jgi:two-component system response regulator AtoC